MKVRLLTSRVVQHGEQMVSQPARSVIEVDPRDGKRLIDAGQAEPTDGSVIPAKAGTKKKNTNRQATQTTPADVDDAAPDNPNPTAPPPVPVDVSPETPDAPIADVPAGKVDRLAKAKAAKAAKAKPPK